MRTLFLITIIAVLIFCCPALGQQPAEMPAEGGDINLDEYDFDLDGYVTVIDIFFASRFWNPHWVSGQPHVAMVTSLSPLFSRPAKPAQVDYDRNGDPVVNQRVLRELDQALDVQNAWQLTATARPPATPTPIPPTPTPALSPTPTITPTPVMAGIVPLGINSETGLEEIRINLPNLPEGAVPFDMVLIPAGTFLMGSHESERGRGRKEDMRERTIAQPFYLGKYELTQAQWTAIKGSSRSACDEGDNFPIHSISPSRLGPIGYFIGILNERGLGNFRLPTEAEWEYACRAGTTTRFSHGDVLESGDGCEFSEVHDLYMWWCGNTGQLMETGLKLPNPWGLYDMHGNIAEWTADRYKPHPSATVSYQLLRGASYNDVASVCRSACRGYVNLPNKYIGMRLAMDPS